MSNPTSYIDGVIIADSFFAPIEGELYVVNNLTMTTPSVATERNDRFGKLAAKKIERDLGRIAGSCELQVHSSVANEPLYGRTFVVPAVANSLNEDFVVVIEEETANVVVNESRTRSVNIRIVKFKRNFVLIASGTGLDPDVDGLRFYDTGEVESGEPIYKSEPVSGLFVGSTPVDHISISFTSTSWLLDLIDAANNSLTEWALDGASVLGVYEPNAPGATGNVTISEIT